FVERLQERVGARFAVCGTGGEVDGLGGAERRGEGLRACSHSRRPAPWNALERAVPTGQFVATFVAASPLFSGRAPWVSAPGCRARLAPDRSKCKKSLTGRVQCCQTDTAAEGALVATAASMAFRTAGAGVAGGPPRRGTRAIRGLQAKIARSPPGASSDPLPSTARRVRPPEPSPRRPSGPAGTRLHLWPRSFIAQAPPSP